MSSKKIIFEKGLRVLKGKTKAVKLFGYDIETYNHNKNFLCCSLVGYNYKKFFLSKKEFKEELTSNQIFRNSFICATNLLFDFFGTFSLKEAINNFTIIERAGSLVFAKTYISYDSKDKKFYSKTRLNEMKENDEIKSISDEFYPITFIDSLNHLRASVDNLGKIIGLNKLKLIDGMIGTKPKNSSDWELMKAYNVRDSEVTYKFMEFLQEQYNKVGANLKITISSTSMDLYRRKYLPSFWKQEQRQSIDLCYSAYYGGRTEAFKRGLFSKENFGKIKVFDINSLYPFCLKNFKFPVPNTEQYKKKLSTEDVENFTGVGYFKMKVPKDINIPIIPYKTDKLLFPVGTFGGYYDFNTIKIALNNGAEIIKTGEGLIYRDVFNPFKNFIDDLYRMKLEFKARNDGTALVPKILMNCFSTDTDILTVEGHKNIKDVKVGDKVYSVNPITLETEIKKVTKTYKYKHSGEMVHIVNGMYDFLVTKNHKFLLKHISKDKNFKFVEAENINYHYFPEIQPLSNKKELIIDLRKYILKSENIIKKDNIELWKPYKAKFKADGVPFKFFINDFMELCGWYISEGSIVLNGIQITQHDKKNREHIENLLKRLNVRYYKNKKCFCIYHRLIRDYMIEFFGCYSGDKFIHNDIFNYDCNILYHLFKSMMWGDGCLTKKSKKSYQTFKYTTKSKHLAQCFQRLCFHLGIRTKIVFEEGNKDKQRGSAYRIFIYRSKKNYIRKSRNQAKLSKNNSNYVYCIEVEDNHTCIAGRNGTMQVTGQSFYGKFGYNYKDKEILGNAEDVYYASEESTIIPTGDKNIFRIISGENSNIPNYVFPILPLYVTSYARQVMYKKFKNVGYDRVLYSDTDCIFTTRNLSTSDELGELKLEETFEEVIIVKPKFYAGVFEDKKNNLIKVKGLHGKMKDYEEFKSMVANDKFNVKTQHFRKLRGSIGHTDKFINQIYSMDKSMDLDDNKRLWEKEHFTIDSQDSRPIKI